MKILVIHPWGLGDLIMATPMLKSLKLSGHKVDLAIFSKSLETLLKENNFLENIYLIKSYKDYLKFFGKYDILVATAGVNPRKIKILNLFVMAKKVFAKKQEKDIHRIKMNLKIVSNLLTKTTKEPYIFIKDSDAYKKYFSKEKKNIAFAVGSGSKQKFKRWNGFRDVIKVLQGRFNILVFIGADEVDLEKEYEDLEVKIIKEHLEDVVSIVSKLDLLVGNDNGIMHIGYATKVNTVTIFGMTNEKETGSYRKNSEAVFVKNLECRPCFDPSTDKIGCFTLECLKYIQAKEVVSKCLKFL